MKLRSLILLALVGGIWFARIPESHAITTCNVCADGAHPCSFRCYTGPYDFPFVTTCRGAGYQCIRLPNFATAASSAADQCALEPAAAASADLLGIATGWLRDGLVRVGQLLRVAHT